MKELLEWSIKLRYLKKFILQLLAATNGKLDKYYKLDKQKLDKY